MRSNSLRRSTLTALITLSAASVYYAQTVKDTVSKEADIEQVVLTGVADLAKDRKTPVAVSTIKEAQIIDKLGNQEFPEILNTTPSVYATKGGGGFGDSKVNIRGFDQRNIAVMVNGMPVNDMETGAVYWSNWAGLSDVTSAIQVQRGLGSSKLAIASVGGTINILTRAADKKQGGIISVGVGNDDYHKSLFAYNTGKNENGWSTSFLMSRTAGSTYADGTKFEGYNYYWALGYQPSAKHDLQFTITGAPQWHNQRAFSSTIAESIKYGGSTDKPNRRYNSSWGYLDGEEYSMNRNYFHKPVMSINWDWKMNEASKLSTVLYGSFGRGGGTGDIGKVGGKGLRDFRDANTGLYNFDALYAANQSATPQQGTLIRRSSINSHNWFGAISSFNHKINDNLNFSVGVDGRYYYGYHYRIASDFLGASGYLDKSNKNNPNNVVTNSFAANADWNPFGGKITDVKDQIGYSNDGQVLWYGAFGQLEYSKENVSAFVQGSVSNQGFQRIDNFILDGVTKSKKGIPMNTKSGFKNIIGYNVKGGINYNINENHNVFANAGYYEKQPFFNAVYRSNENIISDETTNEKIFGLEVGYGFRSGGLNANVNLYRTTWKDRYQRKTGLRDGSNYLYAELNNLDELHQGVEFDATYKFNKYLSVNAMFSYGDWKYMKDATADIFNDNDNTPYILPGKTSNHLDLYLTDAKVGDAAQMTAAAGLTATPVTDLNFDVSWRYVDNLYANMDPYAFSFQNQAKKGTLALPSYNLMDLGLSYKIRLNNYKQYFTIRGNVYNVFDTTYISESYTSINTKELGDFTASGGQTAQQKYDAYINNPSNFYKGLDTSNQVYFGFGRTWSATLSFNF